MQLRLPAILMMSCALSPYCHSQSGQPLPRIHGAEKQASAAAAANQPPAPKVDTTVVPMDQAVITLKHGCQAIGDMPPAKDCVPSVTRAQFERLTNALQPDMNAETKRSFANNYGKLLVFSDAARALHLENDPNVQSLLQFVGEQVMAEAVKHHYAELYAHPSEQQIQAYYKQNSAKYRETTLQRVIVPRIPDGGDKPKSSDADQAAAAEKIRQKWIAGDDPVKLQEAAYEAAGVTGAGSPEVNLGARRPGSLPVNQEPVFQLKAGEVSPVFSDQAAFYIYKIVSVREIPISEVQDQISRTLQQQHLQDKLEEINKSATPVLNEAYFGATPVPNTVPGASRPGPGAPIQPGNPPQ